MNKLDYGIKEDGKYTGYFYLSYDDATITGAESMEFSANLFTEKGFYTLQHDYMPAANGFFPLVDYSSKGKVLSSANVFEGTDAAMEVKSVSTRTSAPNMRVTYAIYLLADNAANPADGTLVRRISKNYEHAGFHRLDLDQPLKLEKGQRFSVVSSASTLETDGTRQYSVSVAMGLSQQKASAMGLKYYDTAVVNPGESFLYSESDGSWTDWSEYLPTIPYSGADGQLHVLNDDYPLDNFSIKVYAVPVEPEKTSGLAVGETATAGKDATRAEYLVTGTSTVTYQAVVAKDAEKATVPNTVKLNGKRYKVTKIADGAFKGSKATRITVGDNVKVVDEKTLSGAKKAQTIVLGKRVAKVAPKAFATNGALRTLIFKTTKLTKKAKMKNCLKGSKVQKVVLKLGTTKTNNKYAKQYKKLFSVNKPASGKKVAVS